MGFEFGSGGQPSKRERIMVDKYPELTQIVIELSPSTGNPGDGWTYVQFPLNGNSAQDDKAENRVVGNIRHRINSKWGDQFTAEVRPRPEDADIGMNRIWFRVVRK